MNASVQRARQLVLDLPHRAALGREDFLVSRSNAAAVAMIDRWPDWPHPILVLVGPQGAGKTHLAHVWRTRSRALMLSPPAPASASQSGDPDAADALAAGALKGGRPLVIEDIDRGLATLGERSLFHLLNLARERGAHMLMTARRMPAAWDVALADLASRLRALPVLRIDIADEMLMRTMLVKLFADRQLMVEPHVIDYLARHITGSPASAIRVVAAVDRAALAVKRKVSLGLAREALAELAEKAE